MTLPEHAHHLRITQLVMLSAKKAPSSTSLWAQRRVPINSVICLMRAQCGSLPVCLLAQPQRHHACGLRHQCNLWCG